MNALSFIGAHLGDVFSVVKQAEAAAADPLVTPSGDLDVGKTKKDFALNLLGIALKADGMSEADIAKWMELASGMIDLAVKLLNALGVFKKAAPAPPKPA